MPELVLLVAAASSLAAFSIKSSGAAKFGRKYCAALVGCGWWGGNILVEANASRQCEVVGLCDVDDPEIASTVEKISKATGDQLRKDRDYRELLAKDKPEIVRASVGKVEASRRFLHATTLCAATSAASLFLVTGSALSPVQQGTREKCSRHRAILEQAGPRKIGSTIYEGVNVV